MDDDKKDLEGSRNRDRFKQLHKTEIDGRFYALDIDFALVSKNKVYGDALPMIVAIVDFKMPGDDPTFTEVLAYNQFKEKDIPVYFIEALNKPFADLDPEKHRFRIKEYLDGDWRPKYVPTNENVVAETVGWDGLEKWERELRQRRKEERRKRYEKLEEMSNVEIDGGSITDYSLLSTVKNEVKSRPSLVDELVES